MAIWESNFGLHSDERLSFRLYKTIFITVLYYTKLVYSIQQHITIVNTQYAKCALHYKNYVVIGSGAHVL